MGRNVTIAACASKGCTGPGVRASGIDVALAQRLEIGDILGAASGTFVGLEVGQGNKGHLDITRLDFPPTIACLENDAGNTGEQFDSQGRVAHADDFPPDVKRGRVHDIPRKTELRERSSDTGHVLGRGGDPDVQVAGGAGVAMKGDRMPPNHEVLNARRVQQLQELFEFGRKLDRSHT